MTSAHALGRPDRARQCPILVAGRDCWNPSHPDSKMGLCLEHWTEAADGIHSGHDLLSIRCRNCGVFALRTVPSDAIAYCINPECATVFYDVQFDGVGLISVRNRVEAETVETFKVPKRASVVYYIQWADRIKIGVTSNLPQRLKALYFDDLLAVEPGGPSLEAHRHSTFNEYRLPVYREWFSAAPALMFHIATVRDKHGAPMDAYRRTAKIAA